MTQQTLSSMVIDFLVLSKIYSKKQRQPKTNCSNNVTFSITNCPTVDDTMYYRHELLGKVHFDFVCDYFLHCY